MRLLLAITLLCIVSCGRYTNDQAEKDIHLLLKDDLRVIVTGIDPKILLEVPFDTIVELKWYEKSRYSCNVVADFYFLKDSSYCVERKYRLNKAMKKWERYHNEYKLIEK